MPWLFIPHKVQLCRCWSATPCTKLHSACCSSLPPQSLPPHSVIMDAPPSFWTCGSARMEMRERRHSSGDFGLWHEKFGA